jgi:beta-glucanase (GH16 family)
MLPAHYQYGSWPASGEIDLVESRGNGPEYPGGGCDKVASTLHWGRYQVFAKEGRLSESWTWHAHDYQTGPSYEFNRYPMTHAEYALPNGKTFADDFHVFTLDWKPEGIKTYVDGKLLLDVPFNNMFKKGKFPAWIDNLWAGSNAAPFDQEFYLVSGYPDYTWKAQRLKCA